MFRIPVPLIVYETLEKLYGPAVAKMMWLPIREVPNAEA